MTAADPRVAAWLDALIARHTAAFSRSELLKAIRALSSRYVERRADLPHRSVLDSAGKRAAFAVFYAPLHLLTTLEVVRALGAADTPGDSVFDLGCGTGVAAAAWALARADSGERCRITGIDRDAWALEEARWNWRALGLSGTTRRGDLARAVVPAGEGRRPARTAAGPTPTAWLLGWSVNELVADDRLRLRHALVDHARHGARVLVLEPIARRVTPWWDDWAAAFENAGGRADDWSFPAIPSALVALDAEAGFDRRALTARTLYLPPAGR